MREDVPVRLAFVDLVGGYALVAAVIPLANIFGRLGRDGGNVSRSLVALEQ
jgi:hypothetical protein